jgi:glycosyltransferase involved in cell wall biosynthesis
MLAHGTDVRLPSRHAAAHPDSPYHPEILASTKGLEREARANVEAFRRLRLPIFVSTPDLLDDLPEATWLPVVVDTRRWVSDVVPLERRRPVVVHVPSSAAVKGSELVDPAMRRLDAEGVIEYRRVERLPAERMPAAYGDADIVLDQFRLGSYGVAACEAMSSGRIVVGHVSVTTRDFVRSATGTDLPIVQSAAGDIESTVRRIVSDRDAFRGVGALGRAFVTAVHDGRRSADALRPFLTGD